MSGNQSSTASTLATGEHRIYSDEDLAYPNRRFDIIGTSIPFLVLAWTAVTLRLYTRLRIVRAPGWDDLLIGFALVTGSISGISLSVGTKFGMGYHIVEIPSGELETLFLIFYISNATFTMSNTLIKVSLLLQYLRTFVDLRLRRLCFGLIAITCLYGLTFGFFSWFPCFPVEGFWRQGLEAKCYAYGSEEKTQVYLSVLTATAINMALDTMVFILPIPLLFRKDTLCNTKIGLLALFGLGVVINVVAGLRVAAIRFIVESGTQADLPFNFPRIFVLAETENKLSCILASIPVFWPVVTDKLQKMLITRELCRAEGMRSVGFKHVGTCPRQGGGRAARDMAREMPRQQYGYHDKHSALEYQEDEVLEAGLRHPGRRVDI